jgi:hypothetical protein
VLKTENLDKELHKNLVIAFKETVNLDNDSVNPDELWNWVKNIYTHRQQPVEISETQIQPTDEDKLKWIQEYQDSPVTGHPV